MKNDGFDRRAFLKGAVAGGAAAATVSLPRAAEAQQGAPAPGSQGSPAPANTYAYLNPDEAAFVEALVDHMVPADSLTPKGAVDVGVEAELGALGRERVRRHHVVDQRFDESRLVGIQIRVSVRRCR